MRHFFVLLPLLLVCLLCAHAEEAVYTGTAFVVHPDGFLITCNHVVEGATHIEVQIGAKSYKASVLVEDAKRDLALLQIGQGKLTPLPLANSNQVQLGEEVRACGFPLASTIGTDLKVTRGTVSGITTLGVQKVFQVDAPINAGNSGGPLVNEKGEVVGVVNAKLEAPGIEGVGFSVPINYARRLLELEGIETAAGNQAEKLDGPALVKRVSASIVFIKVTADEGTEVAAGEAVQAKQFELVDDDGTVRARLSMADGAPALILFDGKGLNRMQVALGNDGEPSIILTDANDVTRAQFAITTKNSPSLMLSDAKGNIRTYLDVDDQGRPAISLCDAEEATRALLWLDTGNMPGLEYYDDNQLARAVLGLKNNAPSLSMNDSKGNTLAMLTVTGENVPSLAMGNDGDHMTMQLCVSPEGFTELEMRDQQNVIRALMAVYGDGNSLFSLSDKGGNPRIWTRVKNETPLFGVTNADGNFVWSAP